MPIPTYTEGYPLDGSSLGQTKSTIRDNLDGTFLTLAVDHINNNGLPGDQPAGYHKVIHLVQQAGNPTPINSTGQLYIRKITSGGNSDEALFYESGGGIRTQITTNVGSAGDSWLAASNGWTTLFGGMVIQWGKFNPTSSINVSFPIKFPNAVFNIQLTGSADNNSSFRNAVSTGTLTQNGFTWEGSVNVHVNPVYFVAIGN